MRERQVQVGVMVTLLATMTALVVVSSATGRPMPGWTAWTLSVAMLATAGWMQWSYCRPRRKDER